MRRFLARVGARWYLYLAAILAMLLLWSVVFNVLTRVDRAEKVSVFLGTYASSFSEASALEASRPAYLKAIELSVVPLGSPQFLTYLRVFLDEGGDILVLPASQLEGLTLGAYFSAIHPSVAARFDALGYLQDEAGEIFGFRVHDAATHESRISSLDYGTGDAEEDFYLLFSRASLHLGGLSDDADVTRDGAATIAERLLRI